MIWFFLAGFISGAVGVMMYAHWWMRRHATVIHMREMEEFDDEEEEDEDD